MFEGLPLTVALAAEAALLAAFLSQRASLAFAALAAVHALVILAPPLALVDGLDRPLEAAAALAAVVAALAFTPRGRQIVPGALLYLASVQVVTAGGAEHTGQTLLSVLWALTGVSALVFGPGQGPQGDPARGAVAARAHGREGVPLRPVRARQPRAGRELHRLRHPAALGAFAWQRVRPRALPWSRT